MWQRLQLGCANLVISPIKSSADQLAQQSTLVIKPLFGSQGQGVRLVNQESKSPLPKDSFVDGVYYSTILY